MSKYNTQEFRKLAHSYFDAITLFKKNKDNQEAKAKIDELLEQPHDVLKRMCDIDYHPFVQLVEDGLEKEATALFNNLPELGKSQHLLMGLPLAIIKNLPDLAKHMIDEKPEFINGFSLEAAIRSHNLEMLKLLLDKKADFKLEVIKFAANKAIVNDYLEGFKLLIQKFPDVAKEYGGDLYYAAICNLGIKDISKIEYLEQLDQLNPDAYKASASDGSDAIHSYLNKVEANDFTGAKDLFFVVEKHPDILYISDSNGLLPFDLLCHSLKSATESNEHILKYLKTALLKKCAIKNDAAKEIFEDANYTGIDYLFEIGNKKAASTALIKKISAQIEQLNHLVSNETPFLTNHQVENLTQLFKLDTEGCHVNDQYTYEKRVSKDKVVTKLQPLYSENFNQLINVLKDSTVDTQLAEYIVKGCNMLATKYPHQLSNMMNEAASTFIAKAFSAPGNDVLKGLVLHGSVVEKASNLPCDAIIVGQVNEWLLTHSKDYFTNHKIFQNLEDSIGSVLSINDTAYEIISNLLPQIYATEEVSIAGDVDHNGA